MFPCNLEKTKPQARETNLLSQENKTLLHQEGTNKLLLPKRGGGTNFLRDRETLLLMNKLISAS